MEPFTIEVIKKEIASLAAEQDRIQSGQAVAERVIRDPFASKEIIEQARMALAEYSMVLKQINSKLTALSNDLKKLGVDGSD